ncbi:hypothetical protein PC121_g18528 [Phytophthora cactorum]|nr:hypothetical protein PC120_g20575 [Phytophthora cactorum]KAG3050184.1 hypothetical protein PC121_g18528 [Phytophthora cactorum]
MEAHARRAIGFPARRFGAPVGARHPVDAADVAVVIACAGYNFGVARRSVSSSKLVSTVTCCPFAACIPSSACTASRYATSSRCAESCGFCTCTVAFSGGCGVR